MPEALIKSFNSVNLLYELEQNLFRKCKENKLKLIGGPVIMFSADNGRSILYVNEMSVEKTGASKIYYDRASPFYDEKYNDIIWPYTGFVQGNVGSWYPILKEKIVEWLEESDYSIDRFIQNFR